MKNIMHDNKQLVLQAAINVISWDDAISQIATWGMAHESRYVCICNSHSVVTTTLDSEFKEIVNNADMATADGAPVAWALRHIGFPSQQRINGPDLMWRYMREAERLGQSIFFYGSTENTMTKLQQSVMSSFPNLRVGGAYSPSFGVPTPDCDEMEVNMINRSGAHVVFVGLGCPKQEKWMAAHRHRINAVMIGVGAAFDYHAGTLKRAPLWWQDHGFEWLYRLGSSPRRLLRRYMVTNTLFIIGILKQLLRTKFIKRIKPLTAGPEK